jgi:hypothetical protein
MDNKSKADKMDRKYIFAIITDLKANNVEKKSKGIYV